MTTRNTVLSLLSIIALASCGGGSDDSSTSTPPETTPPPATAPEWEPPFGIGASLIVDANGDGHNDIVINASPGVDQTYDYNSLMLYLNDGKGQFSVKDDAFPVIKFEGHTYILYQDKIMANDDNLPDIVAIETDQAEKTILLHLYIASEEGIYTDATVNITNANYTNAAVELQVADFDGDGFEDFVLTGFSFSCEP